MSLRQALKAIQAQNRKYYLVYWPEEESVSVVSSDDLSEGSSVTVGEQCKVKNGRKYFVGKISAIGTKEDMEQLEDEFIEGCYTPLSSSCTSVLPPPPPPPKKKQRTAGEKETKSKGKENNRKEKEKKGKAKKTPGEKEKKGKAKKTPGSIILVTAHGERSSSSESTSTTPSTQNTPSVSAPVTTPSTPNTPSVSAPVTTPYTPNTLSVSAPVTTPYTPNTPSVSTPVTTPYTPNTPSLSAPVFNTSITTYSEYSDSDSDSDDASDVGSDDMDISDSDPLHLEMTVMDVEERLKKVEFNQQQILQRLEYLEKLLPPQYPWNPASYPLPQTYPPVQTYLSPLSYHQPLSQSYQPQEVNFSQSTCIPNQPRTPTMVPSQSGNQESSEEQGPLPLGNISSANSLPSSTIDKDTLIRIEEVLDKYPKLKGECKAGTLACKLAKEAIFGKEVMKQCTPSGNRELPGLPVKELFDLKKAMFMQFPQYWRSPVEFESIWRKCIDAVQQACKRLRS